MRGKVEDFSYELIFFSKFVRLKRHELDLTQEKMAELIGLHVNGYARIERGHAIPSFVTILKIARAFRISPKDLMPY